MLKRLHLAFRLAMTCGVACATPLGIGVIAASAQHAPVHTTTFGAVPVYQAHVTSSEAYGPHSGAISTTDSMDQVLAWYRRHLPAGTSEKTSPDGHHLFGSRVGAVDVSPDIFGKGTTIGITFN